MKRIKHFRSDHRNYSSFIILIIILLSINCVRLSAQKKPVFEMNPAKKWVLVIHGGAGGAMTEPKRTAAWKKIKEALDAGKAILTKGGSSLDAVETVIKMLEDSPLFNAGKGSVFTDR